MTRIHISLNSTQPTNPQTPKQLMQAMTGYNTRIYVMLCIHFHIACASSHTPTHKNIPMAGLRNTIVKIQQRLQVYNFTPQSTVHSVYTVGDMYDSKSCCTNHILALSIPWSSLRSFLLDLISNSIYQRYCRTRSVDTRAMSLRISILNRISSQSIRTRVYT